MRSMSAVRRCTWPIVAPVAIGRSARAIGSMPSLIMPRGCHLGGSRVSGLDTPGRRINVSRRFRSLLLLSTLAMLACGATALAKNIVGNNQPQHLSGTAGPDVINGLGGRDEVNGRGGDDTLTGDTRPHAVNGGHGNENMDGGPRDEPVDGGAGKEKGHGGLWHTPPPG